MLQYHICGLRYHKISANGLVVFLNFSFLVLILNYNILLQVKARVRAKNHFSYFYLNHFRLFFFRFRLDFNSFSFSQHTLFPWLSVLDISPSPPPHHLFHFTLDTLCCDIGFIFIPSDSLAVSESDYKFLILFILIDHMW